MRANFITLLIITTVFMSCKKDDENPNLAAPVATAATDLKADGFNANWNEVTGATGIDYELDVATDNGFTDIVDAEKNLGLGTFVNDLASNRAYYYRVRATVLGKNPSANSNVIEAFTLPEAPVALVPTNQTSDGFTVNWEAMAGVTNFKLYISKQNFPTNTPDNIPGFDGKDVSGTSLQVTGLEAGTIYYYVLSAVGVNGDLSEISNSVLAITGN